MSEIDELKDLINDYRNNVKNDLSSDELDELDTHINKIISDMQPIFVLLDNLKSNQNVLKEIKLQFDQHAREEKWLEKLLKTS